MIDLVAPVDDLLFLLCLNDRGGAEISMIKLAEGLLAAGRAVTLAVYGSNPHLARELGFSGEVIDLQAGRTATAFVPLCRLLRRRHFVFLISALSHTNIIAIAATRTAARHMRVIVTEHSIDGVDAYHASSFFAALTRFAYERASVVIGVSQVLAEHWRHLLSSRVPVTFLYNPVVGDKEQAPPPPAHEWLINQNIPVIMGIGRLKAEKNFSLLIKAFAEVVEKCPSRLIILGEGEQRKMLTALAHQLGVSDKVLLPGFTANPEAWLAHASLLVCSSKREGFGNVIAEALACGVPVVACDCPCGPAEILEHGCYGRLVPMDDVAAMAVAIEETLKGTSDPRPLRARARAFTISRCIDAYGRLIDSLR